MGAMPTKEAVYPSKPAPLSATASALPGHSPPANAPQDRNAVRPGPTADMLPS